MFWRDRILHHGSSRAGAMNNHHEQDVRLGDLAGANKGLVKVEPLVPHRQ
jgi:hypothetical protein